MIKRPDSNVNQFIRALRHLISDGQLSVNTLGAPVYVTGDKAAAVVPLLKRKLKSNCLAITVSMTSWHKQKLWKRMKTVNA